MPSHTMLGLDQRHEGCTRPRDDQKLAILSTRTECTERDLAMKSQLRKHLWFSRKVFALSLGLLFLPTGCENPLPSAAPSASSTPSSVSVAISPPTATVQEGGYLIFVATVKGVATTTVTWSVQEGTTGGSITSQGVFGVYTAPNTLGTYHVVATSVADATASASAVVTVELPTSTPAGNFTAVGNMTTARADHTATLLPNGKVLIAGGVGDGFQELASAELYDPSTRTFAPTGSMIRPRYAHSATLLADGRILIAGGRQDGTRGTSVFTAEIYDPSTGAFTATGDLTSIGGEVYSPPEGVTTLLPDGRVFVAAANNAEIYDPHSGTFTPTGPYAPPNLLSATVTLLTNGKVLVTGCAGPVFCSVGVPAELFDPQSGTFGVTGTMMINYFPDYGYTATLLTDGRVLFLGSNDSPEPADVEVYDPAAGTFASAGGAVSQELAPASRLTDGTVLVAGGQLPGGSGSTYAQLYVPATGTFERVGEMTASRHSHTATPLPDDTVLITGGFSAWPGTTSSAEVYKPR
jgi:Kelch motif